MCGLIVKSNFFQTTFGWGRAQPIWKIGWVSGGSCFGPTPFPLPGSNKGLKASENKLSRAPTLFIKNITDYLILKLIKTFNRFCLTYLDQ